MSGVYQEIWTGELVKEMRAGEEASFLNRIPSYDQYVSTSQGGENQVIHLVDVGADPKVLINNTTYPIPVSSMNDADVSVTLDKYGTEATAVSDDELHAISYDKIGAVIEKHKTAIVRTKMAKAIHALAPAEHKIETPVIKTGGEARPDGKKALTAGDILKLKYAFDKAKIPMNDRILVLSAEHYNDLLALDQKFALQYYNIPSGEVLRLFGFEVHQYIETPHYGADGKKKSFGAEVDPAADGIASIAFYAPDMFQASGQTKMYYQEARTDPQYQRNLINFTHRFVILPKKQRAIGAIYSDKA